MFNFFKKSVSLEKKSYQLNDLSMLLMGAHGNYSNGYTIQQYITKYYHNSPLYTAIKLIADNITSINKVLYDNKKGEYIYDHPFLNILNNPNPFISGDLFFESIVDYLILGGESYIEIIGDKKPIELHSLPPQYIDITASENDGFPEVYKYQPNSSSSRNFDRFNNKFIATNGNELINIRNFNPDYSANNLRGTSNIQPIMLEISQYLLACVHNESLLKNQGRPSGILTYKGQNAISTDATNRIKETIQKSLSGAKNSGKAIYLPGDFDWKQLSESVKDMDFAKLKTQTSIAIYNALKIPLPMISPDHMSLANMETAKLNFYDNCIIPMYRKIASFLDAKLLARYPDHERYKMTFDPATVEALEPRRTANLKLKSEIGVLTSNELRSEMGYEDIEGGDILYQPSNLVPSGIDQSTIDNRRVPAATKSMRDEFVIVLREHKDKQGNNLFSENEIEELSYKYYG